MLSKLKFKETSRDSLITQFVFPFAFQKKKKSSNNHIQLPVITKGREIFFIRTAVMFKNAFTSYFIQYNVIQKTNNGFITLKKHFILNISNLYQKLTISHIKQ